MAAAPHPRAGLWRWTSQTAGAKDVCLSGQLLSVFASRPDCPPARRWRTASGAYEVRIACQAGPAGGVYARAQGDFNSAFQIDLRLGEATDHIDARYLGPCPPGRRPDDQP